ncbi:anti-sigma factor family protein [Kosakonia oryzendophytica]|uniref:anti-sigma factor family protein n=1 Tax=Kosakonia oryzendophytica TaxID=1005665 RepID=UPI003D33151D
MKSMRFTAPYSDEAIVAWLDGEMQASDAERFEIALSQDEQLAERTNVLRLNQADVARAFVPLLKDAPQARMEEQLTNVLAQQPAPLPRAAGVSRRALIAASLSFLVIGSGLGYFARPAIRAQGEREKIRDLEAQYMSLYSAETLLDADSSPSVLQRGLARTAQDIGLRANAQQLVLHGAELKMVRMLRYDSTSIAQIAWMHADYGPMALCISPDSHPASTELRHEQRHAMNLVWWHSRGYQFVLIGRNPAAQLQQNALTLQAALA